MNTLHVIHLGHRVAFPDEKSLCFYKKKKKKHKNTTISVKDPADHVLTLCSVCIRFNNFMHELFASNVLLPYIFGLYLLIA